MLNMHILEGFCMTNHQPQGGASSVTRGRFMSLRVLYVLPAPLLYMFTVGPKDHASWGQPTSGYEYVCM